MHNIPKITIIGAWSPISGQTSICSTGEGGCDDGDLEKKENDHPAFGFAQSQWQFPHQELVGKTFATSDHILSRWYLSHPRQIENSWRTCVNCVIPVFTDGGGSADVPSHTTILLDEENVDLSGFVNLFVSTLQPHISKIILLSSVFTMQWWNFKTSAQTGLTGGQVVHNCYGRVQSASSSCKLSNDISPKSC